MPRYPKLNLPPAGLRLVRRGGAVHVWDRVRRCWLVLTPEEWVRQHFLSYLIGVRGVAPALIAEEYPVDVAGQPQRADIVVFDSAMNPAMLVECKAPDVKISEEVLAQAVRYNAVVGAATVVLTNGLDHYVYARRGDGYEPVGY